MLFEVHFFPYLDQWFSRESDLGSQGHLTHVWRCLLVSATVWDGCYWQVAGKVRDAAKYSTMHRTKIPTQRIILNKMSIVQSLRNPDLY